MINTIELIEKLKTLKSGGFQVATNIGVLTSTKAIYRRKSKMYIFAMEDKFVFNVENGYSELEFLELYKTRMWLIEMEI